MAWWMAVPAAARAVYKGTKWVKQMRKLKKGGGSTVKNIQSGTKVKGKKTETLTELARQGSKQKGKEGKQIEYFKEGPHKRNAKTGERMSLPVDAYRK